MQKIILSLILFFNLMALQTMANNHKCDLDKFYADYTAQIVQDLVASQDAYNLVLAADLATYLNQIQLNAIAHKDIQSLQGQAWEITNSPQVAEYLTFTLQSKAQTKAAKLWLELEPHNLAPMLYLPRFSSADEFLQATQNAQYFASRRFAIWRKNFQIFLNYAQNYQDQNGCLTQYIKGYTLKQLAAIQTLNLANRFNIHDENLQPLKNTWAFNAKDNSRYTELAQMMLKNPADIVVEVTALKIMLAATSEQTKKAHIEQQIAQILKVNQDFVAVTKQKYNIARLYDDIYQNPQINSESQVWQFILAQIAKFEAKQNQQQDLTW